MSFPRTLEMGLQTGPRAPITPSGVVVQVAVQRGWLGGALHAGQNGRKAAPVQRESTILDHSNVDNQKSPNPYYAR